VKIFGVDASVLLVCDGGSSPVAETATVGENKGFGVAGAVTSSGVEGPHGDGLFRCWRVTGETRCGGGE